LRENGLLTFSRFSLMRMGYHYSFLRTTPDRRTSCARTGPDLPASLPGSPPATRHLGKVCRFACSKVDQCRHTDGM